jgi:hypothetical protein
MALDADTFFGEVDQHITPPMVRLGYNRLATSTGTADVAAALLISQPWWRRRLSWLRRIWPASHRREVVFTVGYEAADVDVARQLEPDDPVHFDELWISYCPASGALDLSSWWRILTGYADWDAFDDGISSSDAELVRRIAVCGQAVESLNS